ncbi:MAG: GGDEF domain-containing protein [Rhodocyclaceae bacterium]|nr:GGDEF domain-containing protein [Rhodocyclaceae bacterium]MBK6908310.1 GGDEF domain-containing protein [Rhodocyclaceae bacterium]
MQKVTPLLDYIQRMTHGRDRPMIELALAQALRTTLNVPRVQLHKCAQTGDGLLVWVAVDVTASASTSLDDGIAVPEHAVPVAQLPLIETFIRTGVPDFADERNLLPIVLDNSQWFGFIEVDGDMLDLPQMMTAGQLVAVFRNMIAILDYSENDALTGLPNRKTFDDYLIRILTRIELRDARVQAGERPARRRSKAEEPTHWLGVIDIDHFKRVNDGFGHSIGDEVLLLVANMMKQAFRTNDKLFRFGGEEFVVLLKPGDADSAHAAFERFRQCVEAREFPLVGRVTVSIGYVRIQATDQRTTIFDRADEALYWAKEHGRNQSVRYEDLIARGELQVKEDVSNIEFF